MENIVEKSVLGLAGMALTINAVISAIPVSQGASKETVLAAYNAGSAGEKIAFSTPAHANVPLALVNGGLGAVAVWTALKGVSLKPLADELEPQPKPKAQPKPKPEFNFNLEESGVEADQPDIKFEEPEVEVDQPEITPPQQQQQPKEWDLARATARLKLQMPRTNVFDWDDIFGLAQGMLIAGDSGAGKSCVASWMLGWLTQKEPSIIFIIDHHGGSSWTLSGVDMAEVVSELDKILTLADVLFQELERRQRLFKKNKPVGPKIIVMVDEFSALLNKMQTKDIDPRILQDLVGRLLIEGRKFGMTIIVVAHNINCSEFRMSANQRDSFGLIMLGSFAKKALKKEMGINADNKAYPCFLGGIFSEAIAVHPTHGWAKQFALNGVAPKGILPIKRAELDPDSMLGMISELLRDDS